MPNQQANSSIKQSWPISALVAIMALLALLLVSLFAWQTQQAAQQQMQKMADLQLQTQHALQAQFEHSLQQLQDRQQLAQHYSRKLQAYSQLMGLLSDIYIETQRVDSTALEESYHRAQQALYQVEPFLSPGHREWLMQQLTSIYGLSRKLADPMNEYEENLLASKTRLRQLIDETHQGLYTLLFAPEDTQHDETTE